MAETKTLRLKTILKIKIMLQLLKHLVAETSLRRHGGHAEKRMIKTDVKPML